MPEPCHEFRLQLERYLDGELDPAAVQTLEEHLSSCSSCRKGLEEHARLDHLLRESLSEEPIEIDLEEQAVERVIDRIEREPSPPWEATPRVGRARRRIGWRWSLRWAAGAAVATAAVLLALRLGPIPVEPEKPKSMPTLTDRVPSVAQTEEQEGTGRSGETTPPEPTAVDRARARMAQPTEESPGIDEDRILAETRKSKKGDHAAGPLGAPDEGHSPPPPPPMGKGEAILESASERLEPSVTIRSTGEPPEEQSIPMSQPETGEVGRIDAEIQARDPEDAGARSPPEGTGGIRSLIRAAPPAPEAKTGRRDRFWSDRLISSGDTIGPTNELIPRLESAGRQLLDLAEEEIEAAERAIRWRRIGDLWEWVGRKEDDSGAFARALQAYRLAVEADRSAADLDSTRVRRARSRASDEREGNKPGP